jgi:cytosine/adenosine deaminase-related metal-dependent hydrolase
MTPSVVIENCAIATMDGQQHDDSGTEYPGGYITVAGGRITAVGAGQAPPGAADGARRVDGTGCLATPGLVNTHHHLYQWLTQGLAQQSILFDWALWLGTRGGARCLGQADEIGALRPGLLADIALWRVDTLAHDAIAHGAGGGDPVAALVLGPPAPLELLLVGGTPVVERGELRTADVTAAASAVRAARLRLEASG